MAYRLPMFPLSTVLFPGGQLTLHLFEPRYRQLAVDCLAGSREFGVVLISRGSEVGGGDQRVSVGSVAHIEYSSRLEDGRWLLIAYGRRRIRVLRWLPGAPYPVAEVEDLPDDDDWADPKRWQVDEAGRVAEVTKDVATADAAIEAVNRTLALLSELDRPVPSYAPRLPVEQTVEEAKEGEHWVPEPGDPGWLSMVSWRFCAMSPLSPIDAQRLLEGTDPKIRLVDLTRLMDEAAADLVRLLAGG